MQVVCEATQATDIQVKVAALQCLVKIMSLYYQYMESYMGPALFAITLEAMKSEAEEVKHVFQHILLSPKRFRIVIGLSTFLESIVTVSLADIFITYEFITDENFTSCDEISSGNLFE